MKSLAYRPAIDRDRRFIEKTFLDSYRTSHSAGLIRMGRRWFEVMREEIAAILDREGVECFVAHHPGAAVGDADLYGWIGVERGYFVLEKSVRGGRFVDEWKRTDVPLVHYVFVKAPCRRMGIARDLFRVADVDPRKAFRYSAKTGLVSRLRSKIPGGSFDPLIARYPKNRPGDGVERSEDEYTERTPGGDRSGETHAGSRG